jgi:Big-like domain-containing protein/Kelch motif protein
VSAPVLVSIAVTPANPSIPLGRTQQFTATGTFSAGPPQILDGVSWSSLYPPTATIDAAGLATSVSAGFTTIFATSGSITGSTDLIVLAPIIAEGDARISIDIFGSEAAIPDCDATVHGNRRVRGRLHAGCYNLVTWSSSSTQVASISGSGLATAGRIGWTFIEAGFPHTIMGRSTLSTTPFTPTGSLNIARYGHTATLLPSGKVLIAGGRNSTANAISSVELFDPLTQTFTVVGNMTNARHHHTATLVNGEWVLIAGGSNETTPGLSSADLYNPFSGSFSATGNLSIGRGHHTATLLNDGTVLVAGGIDSFGQLSSAERYFPTGEFFRLSAFMAGVRSNHAATLLHNGSVLITGGASGNSTSLTAELYYPPSETFTATGNMNSPREGHTATLGLPGPANEVLTIGGHIQTGGTLSSADDYRLDTSTPGTFTRIGSEYPGSLYTARTNHTATLLPSGMLLIAGGMNESGAVASAEWAYLVLRYTN